MIEERKSRKESVYIHCKAGRGRSAVVTACYLVKVCSNVLCMHTYYTIMSTSNKLVW